MNKPQQMLPMWPTVAENERLLKCIKEAMPHVYRQQGHGKHEQDRIDATAWWAEWRDIRHTVSDYGAAKP